MNRSRFIQGLKGDIQLSEKERKRIIRKSLQKYSWKTKCTVAMEEFAELQQQISKQVRGYGDRIGLFSECRYNRRWCSRRGKSERLQRGSGCKNS